MKFICDVHIACKIVHYLRSRGCECTHVNHVFSNPETEGVEIAQHANNNGLIVVTQNSDIRDSFFLKRFPKKLLKQNTGNSSTGQISRLFENNRQLLVEANDRAHFFVESDIFQFYLIETEV